MLNHNHSPDARFGTDNIDDSTWNWLVWHKALFDLCFGEDVLSSTDPEPSSTAKVRSCQSHRRRHLRSISRIAAAKENAQGDLL